MSALEFVFYCLGIAIIMIAISVMLAVILFFRSKRKHHAPKRVIDDASHNYEHDNLQQRYTEYQRMTYAPSKMGARFNKFQNIANDIKKKNDKE